MVTRHRTYPTPAGLSQATAGLSDDRKAWVRRWATGAVLVTAAWLHTYAYYFNLTPGIYTEGGDAQSVAHLNDSYTPLRTNWDIAIVHISHTLGTPHIQTLWVPD